MKLQIQLEIAPADAPHFYHSEKYDESGNVVGEKSPEERIEWLESNRGKIRHRLIAEANGKRKVLEGPTVNTDKATEAVTQLFHVLGQEVSKIL